MPQTCQLTVRPDKRQIREKAVSHKLDLVSHAQNIPRSIASLYC